MDQRQRRQYLIEYLRREDSTDASASLPSSSSEQKRLLRGLLNIREPKKVSPEFLRIQDSYLKEELKQRGLTRLSDLVPVRKDLYLWQGDISTLQADAIVNAANSGMTGCYYPNHKCIDNCIHTFAGVQLRYDCHKLIEAQGFAEPVGQAKITKAYNLPCRYVIHTVGPVVNGPLTDTHREQLRSCYYSCLSIADLNFLNSLAFCCISTGEFHFPNEEAARIATDTVFAYKKTTHSTIKVIFNVFKEEDLNLYQRLLEFH